MEGEMSEAGRAGVVAAKALSDVHVLLSARLSAEAERRGAAGAEMSMVKLLHNQVIARATDAALSLLGPAGVADTGAWGRFAWSQARMAGPGLRLAGGTDEIQRNILAERVLGLPKEPR
jgi:acyl-CoA dehydrogenase